MRPFSRRAFIVGAAAVTLAAPQAQAAATPKSAKKLVELAVAEINAIINSGKSERAMIADFEKVFHNYANVPLVARASLGADSRSMSASQLKRYSDVFSGYMARKWGGRFREFIGGKIIVESARNVKSFVEVRTAAHLKDYDPFEVLFMVSDHGGEERFFNMYIEGVNLVLAERTEIHAMLDKRKGNFDLLIKDLAKAG